MSHRILVVDDEPDITALVAYHLAKSGYRVSTATNGPDALKAAREERPDVVVLDLMLPGVSGYDVLAELRKREETRDVGVILLTARREEPDRIKGLSLGADDYVPKPFEPEELALRINAILRRAASRAAEPPETVRFGAYAFNAQRGELTRDEKAVRLTEAEVAMLRALAAKNGDVISREDLARKTGAGLERSVDVQVTRLRRKIEADPRAPVFLQTVRGVGYRLAID